MAYFVNTQQRRSIRNLRGASGKRYASNKGVAFKVTDKEDVEAFKADPAFKKVSGFGAFKELVGLNPASPEQKGRNEEFFESLTGITGVGEASAELLTSRFPNEDRLRAHIEGGGKPPQELTSQAKKAITEHYKAVKPGAQ